MERKGNSEKTLKELIFSSAMLKDEVDVRDLLAASGLPDSDIGPHLLRFILAKTDKDEIVGVVGLEIAEDCALLRSLAVKSEYRSIGLGEKLCAQLENQAKSAGFNTLYLMTTTATEYFERRGYIRVDRSAVPPGIRDTRQFTELCPSSAVVMKKSL